MLERNADGDAFGQPALADKLAVKALAADKGVPHLPILLDLPDDSASTFSRLQAAIAQNGPLFVKGSACSGRNFLVDADCTHRRFRSIFADCVCDYARISREVVYQGLTPRAFAEAPMAAAAQVMDLKVHSFHGRPRILQVDKDRGTRHTQRYFDVDAPERSFPLTVGYPKGDWSCPIDAQGMAELRHHTAQLKLHCPYVRVDFLFNGKALALTELTFLPWGIARCIEPLATNKMLSDWIRVEA